MEKPRISSQTHSSQTDSIPWPNQTTTYGQFNKVVSDIVLGDIDGDTFQDAVFISMHSQAEVLSSSSGPLALMIRIVQAGNYRELLNLSQLKTPPHIGVRMLLLDTELNEGDLELVYLSFDARHLIILGLTGDRAGQELFKIPLIEWVNTRKVRGFINKRSGQGLTIEIGDNLLFLSPQSQPQIISARAPLNGGWSNWSDRMCSKHCGNNSISYRIRSCTEPTPRNGGADCLGEAVATGVCTGLPACRARDCLVHEILNEQTASCEVNPNYNPPSAGGVRNGGGSGTVTDGTGPVIGNPGTGSGNGGGTTGPGGGVVSNPSECPSGKVWDSRLYYCFTPYVISDIFLEHTERSFFNEEWSHILHRYRLSLSHPQARGVSARTTASSYCQHKGYKDVLTYETRTKTATTGDDNVFVLCYYTTNGFSYPKKCPVGWYDISFAYRDMTHNVNEEITYLHSVTCRQDEGYSDRFKSNQPQ